MEAYKVELLKTARDELEQIFDYIFLDSPKNAQELIERIFERFHQLEQFPKSGIALSEKVLKRKYGFRMLIEEPYIIFYNLDDGKKTVFIHRILHGARDWLSVLKE